MPKYDPDEKEVIHCTSLYSYTLNSKSWLYVQTALWHLDCLMVIYESFSIKSSTKNISQTFRHDWVMTRWHVCKRLVRRGLDPHFSTQPVLCGLVTYTPKNYHLFKVDKNRMQQCCAAHIVHSCQQYCLWYCSALLRLIAGWFRLNNAEQYCWPDYEQCGQTSIVASLNKW